MPVENAPCQGCGRRDMPLHTDYMCPNCHCSCGSEEYADCPIHVDCDRACKALREPVTPDEVQAAYLHWRRHGWLSGCSHGC